MKGVLILAHGSRERETELTLKKIVEITQSKLEDVIIETAYLQFSEVNLVKGLDNLVAQGIVDIKIVPYFLFAGVHIREGIPKEIEEYLKDKPNIKITMAETLGGDPRMADILVDRIGETL